MGTVFLSSTPHFFTLTIFGYFAKLLYKYYSIFNFLLKNELLGQIIKFMSNLKGCYGSLGDLGNCS